MIRVLVKRASGSFEYSELDRPFHRKKGDVIWADVIRPSSEDMEKLIMNFNIHPLAVEDCLTKENNIKLDRYEDLLFLIFTAPTFKGKTKKIKNRYLFVFFSKDVIITLRHKRIPYVNSIVETFIENHDWLAQGTEIVLHRVLDTAVDKYGEIIEVLEDRMQALEDRVLLNPYEEYLQRIFSIKKFINKARQYAYREIGVIDTLIRDENHYLSEETVFHFKDVRDHLITISDSLDREKESINTLLNIFLSSSNNRLGEIMKVLTLFSAIMLPATFIVGYYGMNFDLPEFQLKPFGFVIPIILMIVISVVLLVIFKRRRWM